MQEEWRNVPGFDGRYQIDISTKEGRCRSTNYRRTGKIKEMTNRPNKQNGRINWCLNSLTKQAAYWIAITYPELVQNEYFEGAEIDHIDTDRLNNHPSNLRWVDRKGQMNNPLTLRHLSESLKGKYTGELHPQYGKEKSLETRKKMSEGGKGVRLNRKDQSKSVLQYTLEGELVKIYPSIRQAERETGIYSQSISYCCLGKKYKTAGGYVWKYGEQS